MSKNTTNQMPAAALVAEFIGTFSLAFAVLASINGVLGTFIATPVVAGFTLFLAVLTIGGISGAHINPGITLGLLSINKVDPTKAVAYIVAQVAGALSAFGIMGALVEGDVLTASAGEADATIFIAEALGMAIFGFGVAAAVHNGYKGVEAAAVVGGSLLLGIMFASVAANGVLNPAVAIAIDSVNAVYLLAPVVGSVVGMWTYRFIHEAK